MLPLAVRAAWTASYPLPRLDPQLRPRRRCARLPRRFPRMEARSWLSRLKGRKLRPLLGSTFRWRADLLALIVLTDLLRLAPCALAATC